MNCELFHVVIISFVLWELIPSPPIATTQRQQPNNLSQRPTATTQRQLSQWFHHVSAVAIIPLDSEHKKFALVVVSENVNKTLSTHKCEGVSTYGDNATTNMVANMCNFVIKEVRYLAIGELATSALQLVLAGDSITFAMVISALKQAGIHFDKALHDGKNVNSSIIAEIHTVLMHTLLCQTICRQLFPIAAPSTVCKMSCKQVVLKLFTPD